MALIDIYRVCEITKLSRSTIYNKVKSQDFPAPGKVPSPSSRGPRLVNRWDEKEVEYWVENSSDKMIWINRLKEQDTLKAPYGDDFLAEARKSEGFSVFGWDEPETMWKKYSPHLIAVATIVVVVSVVKYFLL
jgi:predicted DNA-binding transcriptional regulator AlpA